MKILVLNCGSSSLKIGVFEIADKATEIFKATYEKFEAGSCSYKITKDGATETGQAPMGDIAGALGALPQILDGHGVTELQAVGHRIVHGGENFKTTAVLD
ncbi:MAG: acetate/propionate family kinase, partial [Shinella sp.]